jgi:hypothetical protein
MGTNIGTFGKVHDDLDLEFTYFGDVIRINPKASDLVPLDLAVKAGDMDEDDPRAMALVTEFVKTLIHPDDWDVFWRKAMDNRQSQDDLMDVIAGILESLSGRPTQRLSASSDGPQPTTITSTDGSSSQAVQRALEMRGRPDLARAVRLARESA